MEPFPYRIERLNENRLSDVQRLLAEVLGKKVSRDWVRIKYDANYLGLPHFSSIAYDGDRPICFYGAVPQVFTTPSGERWVGCHIADSMTVTAYQRRGLYRQLALTSYGWMRAAGIKVVYGFNSEATLIPTKKIGWQEAGSLRGYLVTAARWPRAKFFRRIPLLGDWQKRRLRRTLGKYAISASDFSNSNAAIGLTVEYAPGFFASKAFHQNFLVELQGVKFWLAIDAIVRVGDVHFETSTQLWESLGELQHICVQLGYTQLLFQTYRGSQLDAALATRLEGFDSWTVGYMELEENVVFDRYLPNYADQDSF